MHTGLPSAGLRTHQIVEVFADLPDDSGEGGAQQLLHVVRPRAVLAVRLQVVDPLDVKRETSSSA